MAKLTKSEVQARQAPTPDVSEVLDTEKEKKALIGRVYNWQQSVRDMDAWDEEELTAALGLYIQNFTVSNGSLDVAFYRPVDADDAYSGEACGFRLTMVNGDEVDAGVEQAFYHLEKKAPRRKSKKAPPPVDEE